MSVNLSFLYACLVYFYLLFIFLFCDTISGNENVCLFVCVVMKNSAAVASQLATSHCHFCL